MATETRRIKIASGSELANILKDADDRSLLLETEGRLYRITRLERSPDDVWSDYDPETALAGIDAAAGSWADPDPEAIKALIYRGREEGDRPAYRP